MKHFDENNEKAIEIIDRDLKEKKYFRAAFECIAAIFAWILMGSAIIVGKVIKFTAGICILIPGVIWKVTHKKNRNKNKQLTK